MIELRNITKSFGDRPAVSGVSMEMEQGKVNMVIGRSGSGKSVLMKCMVGLVEPDAGTVLYEGVDFFALNHGGRNDIRQQIGMLFQAGALFDSLTTWENIRFPLDMLGSMSASEKDDRVQFCLDRVKLPDSGSLFPSELSGGMMKRVGIARAIALNPKYLFVDEPNSGLDPLTAIVIDELIEEITLEYNTTTVVITHDLNSVLEIGHRINFLHEGQLWWQGNNEDILQTQNRELQDFVYASEHMQQVRDSLRSLK